MHTKSEILKHDVCSQSEFRTKAATAIVLTLLKHSGNTWQKNMRTNLTVALVNFKCMYITEDM